MPIEWSDLTKLKAAKCLYAREGALTSQSPEERSLAGFLPGETKNFDSCLVTLRTRIWCANKSAAEVVIAKGDVDLIRAGRTRP